MSAPSARPSTPPSRAQPPTLLHSAPSPSSASPLAKRPRACASSVAAHSSDRLATMSTEKAAGAPRGTADKDPAPATTSLAESPPLLIKKLAPSAKAPTRGSAFAAGYDLYSAHDTAIPSRGKGLVDTELAIAVPVGTYGRIAPRSGLASKHFIDTGAGVIDADYRGQVKVLLFNHGDKDFEVKEGDRVAQLVLERIYTPEVVVVEELEESVRGGGGFGSTG